MFFSVNFILFVCNTLFHNFRETQACNQNHVFSNLDKNLAVVHTSSTGGSSSGSSIGSRNTLLQ